MTTQEAYITMDGIIENPQDPENSQRTVVFQATPIAAVYDEKTGKPFHDTLADMQIQIDTLWRYVKRLRELAARQRVGILQINNATTAAVLQKSDKTTKPLTLLLVERV